jgi:serine/threonine protein kinase
METIGDYDLLEKIAEGGMGTVYKGRNRQSGQVVAVKVVPPHIASNTVYLRRFEQEYNAARALDHPNVVQAIDFGRCAGTPYLVMEYVDGESLGQRLEQRGRLTEAEALHIAGQVAQGLGRAHELGLVHRDVKPDNIMLTPDGQAKLTDLGLVKERDADLNLTRTGRGLGTPHFMAPEQFRNAKQADARCDIYSLAATLYMMVTGELPFQANGPLETWMKKVRNEIVPASELVPELSERIDWAIRRAMSPEPAHRPASCREFVEDLTGRSTRVRTPAEGILDTLTDLWHLLYKDESGVVHSTRDTTAGVRQGLKDGELGPVDEVRLARHPQGPFEPARHFPEFRDLVVPVSGPADTDAEPEEPLPVGGEPVPPASNGLAAAALRTPVQSPTPFAPISFGPHIDPARSAAGTDWFTWLGLFALALAAAAAGYLLMPGLTALRIRGF